MVLPSSATERLEKEEGIGKGNCELWFMLKKRKKREEGTKAISCGGQRRVS